MQQRLSSMRLQGWIEQDGPQRTVAAEVQPQSSLLPENKTFKLLALGLPIML